MDTLTIFLLFATIIQYAAGGLMTVKLAEKNRWNLDGIQLLGAFLFWPVCFPCAVAGEYQ